MGLGHRNQMEQESALLCMMVYRLSKVVKKMKLKGLQSGGHNEQPNRLKCL